MDSMVSHFAISWVMLRIIRWDVGIDGTLVLFVTFSVDLAEIRREIVWILRGGSLCFAKVI